MPTAVTNGHTVGGGGLIGRGGVIVGESTRDFAGDALVALLSSFDSDISTDLSQFINEPYLVRASRSGVVFRSPPATGRTMSPE